MRFMICSPVIRGKSEPIHARGWRRPPGEGRFAGAVEAAAQTGGVAAEDDIGEVRRAVVEQPAADEGAVAAEDDVVEPERDTVVA
jgi:hypothetical protein